MRSKPLSLTSRPSHFRTLMVLEAGRGPLVVQCLSAACRAKRAILAFRSCQHFVPPPEGALGRGDRVTVRTVCADIREFNPQSWLITLISSFRNCWDHLVTMNFSPNVSMALMGFSNVRICKSCQLTICFQDPPKNNFNFYSFL